MKLILKNTSLNFLFHPRTWVDYIFNTSDRQSFYINAGQNKWTSDGTCYLIERTSDMLAISVTANENYTTGFAFLRSTEHAQDTTPNYCAGTGIYTVTKSTNREEEIPDDCNYIYVMDGTTLHGPGSQLPSSVKIAE